MHGELSGRRLLAEKLDTKQVASGDPLDLVVTLSLTRRWSSLFNSLNETSDETRGVAGRLETILAENLSLHLR
jgi:hypothetical protein